MHHRTVSVRAAIPNQVGNRRYEIQFKEILVLNPRERTQVAHDVIPRRTIDREKRVKATLWDFALDNAGEKGNTYFWYYTPVEYRNIDDLPRDGGDVGVCFDVESRVLKTEGAEYWRKQNYNAMFADLEQKSS